MKLAQALLERSDLSIRIRELEYRLTLNALVQEGEIPAENPIDLIRELEQLSGKFEKLIVGINLTNAKVVHEGVTLTHMLAKRDALLNRISIMRRFLDEASSTTSRATRSEIKILSTVDVKEWRTRLDLMSKELRDLENTIQELNWTSELMESN